MSIDFIKRIITSLILIFLLVFSFFYTYILIITLITILLISFTELKTLLSKIFKNSFFKTLSLLLGLVYLLFFGYLVFESINKINPNFKIHTLYLFLICVLSDIGGLIFGKIFKGRKLTKISPNKTISGSIGSFLFSLTLVPIFYFFLDNFNNLFDLIFLSIIISFFCQLGDLIVSYLKRKAHVKDTGNLLPGHGGFLDRIDGMLLAIPLGILIWKLLIIS
jgi:phosphatidate cytidylyltransferase